ncbi:MAG: ATP-binding protein [Myxococcales bacterium]
MKLFDVLGIRIPAPFLEHEEAGRFLPITNVKNGSDAQKVIGDISALLHLRDRDALGAVQYCISELIRNVLEHAGAPEGAFVCAHNYQNDSPKYPKRVSIAVADCGQGIRSHLVGNYPEVADDDIKAMRLAMQPGITGARSAGYGGAPDNAGAGLFITRCIAKGTGGYFFAMSGAAGYRLRRANDEEAAELSADPFMDRHDLWGLKNPWEGTVVAVEVCVEKIVDFQQYFRWIRKKIPPRLTCRSRPRFI